MKTRLTCTFLIAVILVSLFAVPVSAVESSADNERYIYTYLTNEMGLNTAAACGIMGNIYYETNFTADIYASGFYGLFMYWSGLTEELINWCANNGYNYKTVEGQMAFFDWKMENSYQSLLSTLRGLSNTAESAYSAGDMFCRQFERPSNINYEANKRGSYASGTLFPRYASQDSTETPDAAPVVTVNYTAYVTASALNVRTGPHSSYHVAKSIGRGTKVQIVAEVDGWAELSTGGWVSKTYLSTTPVSDPEPDVDTVEPETPVVTPSEPVSGTTYYVTASALNVRSGASIYTTVINSLKRNETVVVVDEATDADGSVWCELSIGGWVSKVYLSSRQSNSSGTNYTVTASALNVRSSAGTGNAVVNLLWKGAEVSIIATALDALGQLWGPVVSGRLGFHGLS